MQNDASFIKGFLEGNPKILKYIYDKSYNYVEYYVVSRGGSKKDAEDIFHNALLLIFVKLKEGKINIQKFDNYLFTVCKNLWKREKSKNRVTNIDTIPLISEELNMAAFYLENEQWELYKEKFKLISEQCREILKMVFDKKTYDEIVLKYAYSSKIVARQRVFKCKKRLIQLIKKDERFARLKE